MKKPYSIALIFLALTFFAYNSIAQSKSQDPVTYEELYDDPSYESIRKLFVSFQPIYGELWATNPTVGFGADALYMLKDKAQFRIHVRKAYATMFDTYRHAAVNNTTMENEPFVHNHFEFGGAYHFKDEIGDGETRMVLYKRNFQGTRWTAQVPTTIIVPSSLRKIYAARLGGIIYDATTNLNRIMDRQGISVGDLKTAEGLSMPETYTDNQGDMQNVNVFGNISNMGFYAGVSLTKIRNVAVDIDNHEPGMDDGITSYYFDLIITPWINAQDVFYNSEAYDVSVVGTNPIGFRLGMEGRNNRTLSWGYGGEIGYKPGFKKGGFFAVMKLSIPVFATNLEYDAEAFGK